MQIAQHCIFQKQVSFLQIHGQGCHKQLESMFLCSLYDMFNSFLYDRLKKTGRIMGTRAAGVQSIYPLNNLKSSHCIIIKLCENVSVDKISRPSLITSQIPKSWQNISAKFDNPLSTGVMALELAKIAKINSPLL